MAYSSTVKTATAGVALSPQPRAAISWAAVFAGAVIAAALSIMLITGGVGLGFVAMSPFEGDGADAETVGWAAVVWMFVVQIISYGVAGYVTGRLRPIWAPSYSDEVYFRDTAHGLAVWAVSALISIALVGSMLTATAGAALRGGAAVVQGTAATAAAAGGAAGGMAAQGGAGGDSLLDQLPSPEYYVDRMFRNEQPAPAADPQAARAEVARIVTAAAAQGQISPDDRDYVARVIAAETGTPEAQARERIDAVLTQAEQMRQEAVDTAREAADAARKAAAGFALWAFAALLMGAFIAAFMAMVGGRAARSVD